MDLRKATMPFENRFKKIGGGSFKGHLLPVPMEPSSMYYFNPRHILKVRNGEHVQTGDVVTVMPSNSHFFCGYNGTAEVFGTMIHRSFRLFEVTHTEAVWQSPAETTDPVTGLKKKNFAPSTTINATIEFDKQQQDEMRIGADLVRIITNVELKPNDILAGYKIVNCESQLGLWFSTGRHA